MAAQGRKKKADLKIVILGGPSVGKTTFIHRYKEGIFRKDITNTIGASFFLKTYGQYNVAIWDTAGEEKFSSLSAFYSRGAGAAILAFDPTEEETFTALSERFMPLLEYANDDCIKVLVGMKLDLVSQTNREVTPDRGILFARDINPQTLSDLPYFETSSVSGHNVNRVFEYILEHCLGPISSTGSPRTVPRDLSTVDLMDTNMTSAHKSGSCCSGS